MQFEGVVTSTNETLWTFEIKGDVGEITFYASHWACGTFNRLPAINSRVIVTNDHHHELNRNPKKIFLCHKSIVQCSHFSPQRSNKFLSVIGAYRLGIPDLLRIDEFLNLTTLIQPLVQHAPDVIVTSIYDTLGKICTPRRPTHKLDCSSKKLSRISVKTPSDVAFVDETNAAYGDYPQYAFGMHSLQERQVLFGYLHVDETLGLRFIKDANATWPCVVVTTKTSRDPADGLVVMRNCKVYTEIYKQRSVRPLEYVVVDADDVFELNVSNESRGCAIVSTLPANLKFKFHVKFQLLDKSTLMINERKTYEYWLKIRAMSDGNAVRFLIMNNNYLRLHPRFRLDHVYEMYLRQPVSPYKWFETHALAKTPSFLICEGNATILHEAKPVEVETNDERILDVDAAMKHMKTSGQTFSFEGVIAVKYHSPPLDPVTRSFDCTFFGTPGVNTPVLNFYCSNGDKLALYVNNWENRRTPFGLLPNMRVLVRNVVPQKNRYLKCTPFTTFTIVRNESRVRFSSANLCRRNKYDQTSCFGFGDLIPTLVLVRGTISKFSLKSLTMRCRCETCEMTTPCNCQAPDARLSLSITLYMSDEIGETFLISKSTNLLRLLLDLERDREWKLFLDVFEMLGSFTYNCPLTSRVDSSDRLLYNCIQMRLECASHVSFTNYRITCRKMETKINDNNGLSLWFCVN